MGHMYDPNENPFVKCFPSNLAIPLVMKSENQLSWWWSDVDGCWLNLNWIFRMKQKNYYDI